MDAVRTLRTALVAATPAALAAVLASTVAFGPAVAEPTAAGDVDPDTSRVTVTGDGPLHAGFAARAITPVGEPPEEWSEFFTPHPETGAWGEPYEDVDGDGCYSGLTNEDLGPVLAGEGPPRSTPEPHVDQPWNSSGDAHRTGAFEVRGVTIVGDPDATGRWDGVWANAGMGSKCTHGVKDDTWARAVVMESGDATIAMVSLDVIGFFSIEVERMRDELVARYPEMPIDELVVSSTHTHQGVDTMGYWGAVDYASDGKFPAYQAFIRSQAIDAVHEAWTERQRATVKFAATQHDVGIADLRDPQVTNPEARAAQFVAPDGSTIGTLVNWNNHPEAQGWENHLVSSDFPHATRERLEAELGGTAVYFSGAVGGMQSPITADVPPYGSEISWERTYAIGERLAGAVIEALEDAEPTEVDGLTSTRRRFFIDSDNTALRALNAAGVFDLPTWIGGDSWGRDGHTQGIHLDDAGMQARTEMVYVEFGPASILTVPGELVPELELGGYGREDCPEADTGRPYEPPIADHHDAEYRFLFGLAQDQLGYIIPGYDFHFTDAPQDVVGGPGLLAVGALEAADPCGDSHYEETVSISSAFAPWVTCVAAELAGHDLWETEPACSRDNTSASPYGVGGSGDGE